MFEATQDQINQITTIISQISATPVPSTTDVTFTQEDIDNLNAAITTLQDLATKIGQAIVPTGDSSSSDSSATQS